MKTDDLHQVAYVVLAWFRSDVLVLATLVQAAGALLAAGAVRLMAPRLERAAAGPISRLHTASVRRVMTAVAASTPWLLLVLLIRFEELVAAREQVQDHLLRLVESLALAWVIIRLGTGLVRNPRLSRVIAAVAWTIAALNLAGLIGPTADVLGAMAVTVGTLRISMLLLLKGVALLVALLWLANLVSNVIEGRLNGSRDLTPAMQVLAAKLSRAGLLTLAVVFALSAVGIDLTAFAVFTGAIGVGIGFGLQKVISNLISGVILLLDRSIKPGDVIEIEGTYGWITKLNARFVLGGHAGWNRIPDPERGPDHPARDQLELLQRPGSPQGRVRYRLRCRCPEGDRAGGRGGEPRREGSPNTGTRLPARGLRG